MNLPRLLPEYVCADGRVQPGFSRTLAWGKWRLTLYSIERDHGTGTSMFRISVFRINLPDDSMSGRGLQLDLGGTGKYGYCGEEHRLIGASFYKDERHEFDR